MSSSADISLSTILEETPLDSLSRREEPLMLEVRFCNYSRFNHRHAHSFLNGPDEYMHTIPFVDDCRIRGSIYTIHFHIFELRHSAIAA